MKNILIFIFAIILFICSTQNIYAIYDPLSVPNNKIGIHISNENDLENAAKLVNTNGDWGYVTLVITEGERDHDRWQTVFDQMRRFHLIPIIRLATKANGNTWEKPEDAEITNWIAFLNSLNWVTKNRYIVIGNEPNLDAEWGGKANASEYATYLRNFSEKLKAASDDFFILPAGLAPGKNEFGFIKSEIKTEPDIFEHIDGWTSHSYPSTSTSLYQDELNLVGKTLPIFITETGWSEKLFSEDQISQNLINNYDNVWNDKNVVAVTPFILNYPQAPFAEFSWTKSDGTFYKFYNSIENLNKVRGEPIQIESGDILAAIAEPITLTGSNFIGAILAKNTGQSIWNSQNNLLKTDAGDVVINNVLFKDLEPGKLGLIVFKADVPETTGIYSNSLFLTGKSGQRITNSFSIQTFFINFKNLIHL